MKKEIVTKLLSLLGIILTLSLFFIGNRLNTIVTIIVDRLFIASLFTADHNLIMELRNQRSQPSPDLLQASYQSYFSISYDRKPSPQELSKIKTLQDYLNEVGVDHNKITLQANKITNNFLTQKRNIETWELVLFVLLISTQIVNIFLMNSQNIYSTRDPSKNKIKLT